MPSKKLVKNLNRKNQQIAANTDFLRAPGTLGGTLLGTMLVQNPISSLLLPTGGYQQKHVFSTSRQNVKS